MIATCTCSPGTFENGWHEVRCAACQARDLREWDRVWAFQSEVRSEGLDVVLARQRIQSQWALWNYLGMDRAGAWR